jgi:predicted helicase
MDLHLNFETASLFKLEEVEVDAKEFPKPKLKINKDKTIIELDENTELRGIPIRAFDYKLGNRSAIEWVLDQHKEKKSTDFTIENKFNVYRFKDYKEKVIEILKRVCSISIETVTIVDSMPETEENLNEI